MDIERVCVVGLGLMGGSLALGLRPSSVPITVVETNRQTRAAARAVFDEVTADFGQGVGQADLVVLATPVRTILEHLAALPAARPEGCLVLDVGSTKGAIGEAMAALPAQFEAIGGHPMCGKEMAGFAAATADLFHDQTFILCRNERTTARVEAIALDLVGQIGARPLLLPAAVHDSLIAATSHLPYAVAAVLMRSVAALDDDRLWPVSATGFRDTTRLAGSDPQMMLDTLLTNRAAVLDQIDHYQVHLAELRRLLLNNDEAALAAWLAEGQRQYVEYRRKKSEA